MCIISSSITPLSMELLSKNPKQLVLFFTKSRLFSFSLLFPFLSHFFLQKAQDEPCKDMPEMKTVLAQNMVLCEVTDWTISSTLQKTEKIGPEHPRVDIYAYFFFFSPFCPWSFNWDFFLILGLSSQISNLRKQLLFISQQEPLMELLFHFLFFCFLPQKPGFFFFLFFLFILFICLFICFIFLGLYRFIIFINFPLYSQEFYIEVWEHIQWVVRQHTHIDKVDPKFGKALPPPPFELDFENLPFELRWIHEKVGYMSI